MTSVLEAVAVLAESPDYRVLRRFTPDPAVYLGNTFTPPPECKTGVFVDVETTGLDTKTDTIIELALVPFTFDPDGVVYDAGTGLSFFQDPKTPLDPRIIALTGITDDMVKGQAIDLAAVDAMVGEASLVIAHYADFDRKMVERLAARSFREKAWACSFREIDWEVRFGCRAGKLPIILSDACGQFTDEGHRALGDCHAGVNILANARVDGRTALSYLLESARLPTFRVWAVDSPFQAKDKLKARDYHWDGDKKCWWIDVREADVETESMFARDIAGAKPRVERFTAKTRYRA